MTQKVGMTMTFEIDLDVLAEALGISEEEVKRLYNEGGLQELLRNKIHITSILWEPITE